MPLLVEQLAMSCLKTAEGGNPVFFRVWDLHLVGYQNVKQGEHEFGAGMRWGQCWGIKRQGI